jgi:CDP-diacylglycerol--glycerol-3-phosphate 3-phosphatidyltransferase
LDEQGESVLSNWLRERAQGILNSLARGLGALGLTPNALTLIGLGLMCVIGFVIATGNFALGGVLIIVAGIFDALDGSLARLTNRVTRFGAFLDSTTDRFAEGALFLGMLYALVQRGTLIAVYLIFFALLGSLMVSYARARAEGIGVQCKEGMLTRFERIVLIVLGLLATALWGETPLIIVLGFLAVFTNLTAVQRMWLVYRATRDEPPQ